MERHEEAFAEAERALELDPLSLIINAGLGVRFYFARRYEQALIQLRKTLEMDPNFAAAHEYLGRTCEQEHKYEKAIEEYKNAISLSRGASPHVSLLGCAYALAGERGKAAKVLDQLDELSEQRYVSPFPIAIVYACLGDENRTFEWLERAYEQRDGDLIFLKADPRHDGLRSDPRFQDLLRRIGLPP